MLNSLGHLNTVKLCLLAVIVWIISFSNTFSYKYMNVEIKNKTAGIHQ